MGQGSDSLTSLSRQSEADARRKDDCLLREMRRQWVAAGAIEERCFLRGGFQ